MRHFLASVCGAGALVSFVGLMRPRSETGAALSQLYLDHYPGMTERSLQEIGRDAAERFEVSRLALVHRCGRIEPGEVIVFVAAAALHRRPAFMAADYAMDRLKTEAVFWKREDGIEGSRWIEPTDDDQFDLRRWGG